MILSTARLLHIMIHFIFILLFVFPPSFVFAFVWNRQQQNRSIQNHQQFASTRTWQNLSLPRHQHHHRRRRRRKRNSSLYLFKKDSEMEELSSIDNLSIQKSENNNNNKNDDDDDDDDDNSLSRWQRRTAKRRQRTVNLLNDIERLKDTTNMSARTTPVLKISEESMIDWDATDAIIDPTKGGKIRSGTIRGFRKRTQIQAFYSIVSNLLHRFVKNRNENHQFASGITIIDAGCGAGNLAIALAGLPYNILSNEGRTTVHVLAVDVNSYALERLAQRVQMIKLPKHHTLETCLADLADVDLIQSHIPHDHFVIVVSLHACGAASDMAINLAVQSNKAPFVICPCCTAKSLTKRKSEIDVKKNNKISTTSQPITFDLSASFQRSGATDDIVYPRSNWLRKKLQEHPSGGNATSKGIDTIEEHYTTLAKIADIGLGPQTPTEQREHQRRAKTIVEWDRLFAASENHGYDVRLMKIQDIPKEAIFTTSAVPVLQADEYGKGDLLIGGDRGTWAANVITKLPSNED